MKSETIFSDIFDNHQHETRKNHKKHILRRRKTSTHVQRKSFGYDCYLPGINGEKMRVCK